MVLTFFSLIIIILIYYPWINFSGTLSGGDWPYLFVENIKEFSFFPPDGSLWLTFYYQSTAKLFVEYFGLSWEIAEKILWFWPFLLLSIISSYYLTKSWIGVLIYTTNTYILMVVGGGQMGVALAYSIAPLVLARFMKLIENITLTSQNFKFHPFGKLRTNFKLPILAGLLLAVLTMFDPRIAYILMIAVTIYLPVIIVSRKRNFSHVIKFIVSVLIIPISIAIFLNSYWIAPLLLGNLPHEYEGLGNTAGFEFLSFANFPHTLTLLHPNWPENIFGKVYFLQPEFLILPLIAFLSLFFASNKNVDKRKKILYFALLAIIGGFLAKGANYPFGEINLWIFKYISGMSMFRDASKFYLLIVLGYSVLIPFSLKNIAKKVSFGKLIYIIFILFWCILIRQAIFGELGGTFKPKNIPAEYIKLKQYLISKPQHPNSLWIPSKQRFGFSSSSRPGISASEILDSSYPLFIAKAISNDKNKEIYNKLKEMRISHIIVPYDSNRELFILDRKYSNLLRDKVVMELDKTKWLVKIPEFSSIGIYRVR